jgi:cytochrome oxidase assembly protein ShyY1
MPRQASQEQEHSMANLTEDHGRDQNNHDEDARARLAGNQNDPTNGAAVIKAALTAAGGSALGIGAILAAAGQAAIGTATAWFAIAIFAVIMLAALGVAAVFGLRRS